MVLPSRRLVTRPTLRSTARCWLMLGTWQPTRELRSLTESSPMASDSRTHSRFGIRERSTDRGVPLAVGLGRDRQVIQHASKRITTCANTQVMTFGSWSGPAGRLRYSGDAQSDRAARADPRRARGRDGASPSNADPGFGHGWTRCPGGRDPARRRSRLRQGRAPPEDGLVQAARDDRQGRGPVGRPATGRDHHPVRRQRRPGVRLGRPRGGRARRSS